MSQALESYVTVVVGIYQPSYTQIFLAKACAARIGGPATLGHIISSKK